MTHLLLYRMRDKKTETGYTDKDGLGLIPHASCGKRYRVWADLLAAKHWRRISCRDCRKRAAWLWRIQRRVRRLLQEERGTMTPAAVPGPGSR